MAKRGRRAGRRRAGGPSYEEVMAEITAKEEKRRQEREQRAIQRKEDQKKLTAPAPDPNNRINLKVDDIIALGDPNEMMVEILKTLTDTEFIPDPGEYYTFIYNAKTPRIEYDQHPLIACLGTFNWGFRGFNFHWALRGGNPYRNYTWDELPTGRVHLVRQEEIQDMRSIPYQYFRLTSS